mmetsp:Transcript_6235/g.9051  ORF Transcript_6235/g.9051 Transcript_6235/m.9051 type:complete len:807 (-) Transcript_6235:128-2548(-)|eukprot:CAMPEP_0184863934 /NCGR_PEP_ID=MMETSP0580-20130426/13026_1 /TAXON_ID=1118495 /ORGANISM="Dactyliosolen fragilissimus" /LENGTH=806 /DNA_ID=CAMNT_0027362525 /DNA_START=66 /DNA_END=2486 /DNA_ORIENTATION=+
MQHDHSQNQTYQQPNIPPTGSSAMYPSPTHMQHATSYAPSGVNASIALNSASQQTPVHSVPLQPGTTPRLTRPEILPPSALSSKGDDEEMEDGRIRNKKTSGKIRDAWIYKKVKERASAFTSYGKARIFLGTWNVNAKGKGESLDSWLCSGWGQNGEYAPDIVVVGLQEMVDLNAVNVAVDNKSAQRCQHWVERIKATLNDFRNSGNDPNRAYNLIAQKYLVGLLICVLVKNKHSSRVKHVHTDSVGVGVMGMMGNKGGVSTRLQFYDSTICIVNSHLAAHRENVAGRNADFKNISSKLKYEIGAAAVREGIQNGSLLQLEQDGNNTPAIRMLDHDIAFWMGDLNYRVGDEDEISTAKVLELSEANQFDELRRKDQLNIERAQGRVFQGFEEGVLNFPPTYKYQPGTDVYDKRPDKKIRAPAWCDRVLWSAQDPSHVTQLTYTRSELNISDHKPVMSTFAITVKDVDVNKRDQVHTEVLKKLDQYENQSLPMVGLDRVHLDYGEIHYNETMVLPITVTNTGKVVAQFRLVPKLDESVYCKNWMTISPTYGMLLPGEEAIIKFTISINNAVADALSSGRELLEDIIILRLENGRDYYITVTGKYARSCFGMSVDELVLYSDPIRSVPLDPIRRAERYGTNQAAVLCVPKELWRIVDAIFEKGLQENGLFVTPGLQDEVVRIRECLDTGAKFGDFEIHSMAEVLISFLRSLSLPIVPKDLFPTLEIDANNVQSTARVFLEKLPPIHYNVFIYIISFFRECLRQQKGLIPATLSRICGDCLVIDEAAKANPRRKAINLIMYYFLDTNSI